jgi:hypothetical protein
MASLLPSNKARWWRFPVSPPKPRRLDHTMLTGRNRAVYPVHSFTLEQCRSYVIEPHRGHYCRPYKRQSYPGELFRGHRMTHDHFKPCWETWSWQTSKWEHVHIMRQDIFGTRVLVGYGDRRQVERKTFTYDRALIKTTKRKAVSTIWVGHLQKLLTTPGPSTVCGKAMKLITLPRWTVERALRIEPPACFIIDAPKRPARVPERLPPQLHFLSKIGVKEWRKAAGKRPWFRYCWLEILWWGPDKRRFQTWEYARRVHWTRRLIPGIVGFQGLHGNTVAKT